MCLQIGQFVFYEICDKINNLNNENPIKCSLIGTEEFADKIGFDGNGKERSRLTNALNLTREQPTSLTVISGSGKRGLFTGRLMRPLCACTNEIFEKEIIDK